jgi:hypothetical protein
MAFSHFLSKKLIAEGQLCEHRFTEVVNETVQLQALKKNFVK